MDHSTPPPPFISCFLAKFRSPKSDPPDTSLIRFTAVTGVLTLAADYGANWIIRHEYLIRECGSAPEVVAKVTKFWDSARLVSLV